MNLFEQAKLTITSHKSDLIPLRIISDLTGIRQKTLSCKILRGELVAKHDGYRYQLTKDVALDIIEKSKSAILGWKRQTEVKKKFGIRSQILFHICKSRGLKKATDYCGYIRFSPETVIALEEILPTYLAGEELDIKGNKYYSLTKLSYDMTLKVHKEPDTAVFRKENERIYKCLYSWCKSNSMESIHVDGKTHIYVSDHVYDSMNNLIRIKDSAFLSGMTPRTIHNWINQGILKTHKSPTGSTLVALKELDNALIFNLQRQLMKQYINDKTTLEQVNEFNSSVWKKMIRSLRSLGGYYTSTTHNGRANKRNEYIIGQKGWNKSKIRAVRAVSRGLKSSNVSLDKKITDGESFINIIEDKYAVMPDNQILLSEINDVVSELDDNSKELICSVFGMNGYDVKTIAEISRQRGVPVDELQNRLNEILVELKDKV